MPYTHQAIQKCAAKGCAATTTTPGIDRWAWIQDWGEGVPDGFYCPKHGDALENFYHPTEPEGDGEH